MLCKFLGVDKQRLSLAADVNLAPFNGIILFYKKKQELQLILCWTVHWEWYMSLISIQKFMRDHTVLEKKNLSNYCILPL